jgi:hypothetical protein
MIDIPAPNSYSGWVLATDLGIPVADRPTPRTGPFRRFTNLGVIAQQIFDSLNFKPPIELYELAGSSNFAETALQNIEPGLGQIKVASYRMGHKLQLLKFYEGQFYVSGETHTAISTAHLGEYCGPVWDYGDIVFMTERPTEFHMDERERLHSVSGPAVAWRDGYSIYAIGGVAIPSYIVEKPHLITRLRIAESPNAEVRRVMIDRYKFGQTPSGVAAFVIDSGGRRLDHDERFGTLWHLQTLEDDEDYLILEVVNRSPEPDGSFKHYFLRVPPQVQTSRQASAWTFGYTGAGADEYDPLKET